MTAQEQAREQPQSGQRFKPLAQQLERAVMTYTREDSRWALLRARELIVDMRRCLDHIDQLLVRGEQKFLVMRSTETQHTDELTEIDQAKQTRWRQRFAEAQNERESEAGHE